VSCIGFRFPRIASHHGDASLGGLLLAAGALGSIAMSLMAGTGALKTSPASRYVTGAGLSVVGLAALVFLSSLPGVTAALIVIGAGLGLENVAVFEALDLVSPRGRSTEAFTWLTIASAAGTALGAALSGRLVEQSSSVARLFLLAAALVGLLVVAARRQAFGAPIAAREHEEHEPHRPMRWPRDRAARTPRFQ
jgi:MFS family permease